MPEPRIRPARERDWPAVAALLEASHLPREGAHENLSHFLVAEDAGALIACAGLECHAGDALLRSCAVAESRRGEGLARELAERLAEHARREGIRDLWLLTTTAQDYFPRLGFRAVPRAEAPDSLLDSAEFRGACPASAVLMRKTLA